MAYAVSGESPLVDEQVTDDEQVIHDIALRWVEYCALPSAARDEFADWGDGVLKDASGLSDEGILRVYDMMGELAPTVHADAQSRFIERRLELARQAEAAEALAQANRLGGLSWRAANRVYRLQS